MEQAVIWKTGYVEAFEDRPREVIQPLGKSRELWEYHRNQELNCFYCRSLVLSKADFVMPFIFPLEIKIKVFTFGILVACIWEILNFFKRKF